ncbi:diacylglycerol O-acyltransferase 1-like isoform X2 [Halichondria panicea]
MADSVARLRGPPKAPKAVPGSEESRNGNEADTSKDYASDMEEYAKQMQRPDRPCHKPCDSLFSNQSGFHNYRGLLNDCILLLVLSNSKSAFENLITYGFLVNPLKWVYVLVNKGGDSAFGLVAISWMFPLAVLLIEQAMAKGRLSQRSLLACHILNLLVMLLLPVVVVFLSQAGPLGSFFALIVYTVIFLKLISYTQVNWWCRNSPEQTKTDSKQKMKMVQYPDNLNVKDLMYFLCAPTLCYELNFPRTKRIRKIFVLRRTLEAIFIINIQMAISQQWLLPIALDSLEPFKDMEWVIMIQRVLVLALPNHLFWLLGFYYIFHSLMNLSGELLQFADRKFYGDWWNSDTIARFWRTWNIPVHRWASRHIYNPLVSLGYGKMTSQFAVFLFSAFFHEYLVSIPLQMLRPWAFVMMVSQIPLGLLTNLPFMRGQIGNIMVWIGIVLGQPLAILMYLHDYYWIHWAPLEDSVVNATNFM